MDRKIPIFPLNIVVFPSSRYPLHIFEERYKKMINKCLSEESGFGIISIINGEISKVGSYVVITDLLKKYDDGKMDIAVKSLGRFFTLNMDTHKDGYFIADVEEYHDFSSEIDPMMLEQLRSKFENIITKVEFKLDDSFWTNYISTSSKSFKIAEKSGLSLEQQQTLLTFQNENKRISFLLGHFEKLDKEISKNAALKELIIGDGYLN
jgi:ATP-dependent Lon protease